MADTWVEVPDGSDFPLANLPFGAVAAAGGRVRTGVAIGDAVLDVTGLADAGLLGDGVDPGWFARGVLDPFLAAGPAAWRRVRGRVRDLLAEPARERAVRPHLHSVRDLAVRLPFAVADLVDFSASRHHVERVGALLRPGQDPLPPAWRHLPIGYHGRAGTVVVSGTDVVRPAGIRRGDDGAPVVGASQRLDLEAEVGFVVGVGSPLGSPVPTAAFADHVFGVVLVNDWSARDLQAFETVPLGPFLGKSFATSISPWVVPLDALAAARVPAPPHDPPPAAHLRVDGPGGIDPWGLDLAVEVAWNGTVVARPPFAAMSWTGPQLLAHLTSNGASLRTGDLLASGTVSGPADDERGCLLELTRGGVEPVVLGDGASRTFLADGDTVTIRATAPAVGGGRLGFGTVEGTVLPAGRLP